MSKRINKNWLALKIVSIIFGTIGALLMLIFFLCYLSELYGYWIMGLSGLVVIIVIGFFVVRDTLD